MESLPNIFDEHIVSVEKKFEEANNQLELLSRRIEETRHRFMLASRDQKRPFRYTLKMKLIVLEGVHLRIYKYAYLLADVSDELQRRAGYRRVNRDRNIQ